MSKTKVQEGGNPGLAARMTTRPAIVVEGSRAAVPALGGLIDALKSQGTIRDDTEEGVPGDATTIASVVVPNVGALESFDDEGFPTGTIANVECLSALWTLQESAPYAPDGITVAPSVSGRFWVRKAGGDLRWAYQFQWQIDASNGDDQAQGDPGNPLRSWDEYRRRVRGVRLPGIHFIEALSPLGNVVFDMVCSFENGLIVGVPVLVGSYAAGATAEVTSAAPHNNTTHVLGSIDLDLPAIPGRVVRVEGGPRDGLRSYGIRASGNTLVTGQWYDPGVFGESFPQVGDTISYGTCTEVDSITVQDGCYAVVQDCEVLGEVSNLPGSFVSLDRCILNQPVRLEGGGQTGFLLLQSQRACAIRGSVLISGAGTLFESCWIMGRIRTQSSYLALGFDGVNGTNTFSSIAAGLTGIQLESASTLRNQGSIVFDNYAATNVAIDLIGSSAQLGILWGRDMAAGSPTIRARAGSIALYPSTTPPDFAPNTAASVGGAAIDLAADLPYPNSANFSGIVINQ